MTRLLALGPVAALILLPAIAVARTRDLVHAVLWFTLTLLGVAVLYAQLDAPFLAGVQVLTYVGGVATLMIFGVMVTQRAEGAKATLDRVDEGRGIAVALSLLVLLVTAIERTDLTALRPTSPMPDVGSLAHSLLDRHLLSFEVLSLLLLGSIVGAAVLARKRDPEANPRVEIP